MRRSSPPDPGFGPRWYSFAWYGLRLADGQDGADEAIEAWNEAAGAWEAYASGGVPVDDRTGQIVSMLTHVNEERWRWGVWWLEPGASPEQRLRFRVDTVTEGPVCSEVFTMSQWFRPEGPGRLEPRACTLGLDGGLRQ